MDDENKQKGATNQTTKIRRVETCILSVFLALVLAAVGFIAGWFGRWAALGKRKRALLWAIDTALSNYYREIDEDVFYKRLYNAFKLDPYSDYYPAADYKQIEQEREGNNYDAGFSIWEEEHELQVYSVRENSSAYNAGIKEDMYLLRFGTESVPAKMQTGDAEDYYAFVGALSLGETYYVLCGTSEKLTEATVYTLRNGEEGAEAGARNDSGLTVYRAYDPMQVYGVVGNSSADRAGLKRGMYILKFGATENTDEMKSGPYTVFESFIASLNSDTMYLSCSFDKTGADAKTYKVVMENYQATYCYYRDNSSSYEFVSENGGAPVLKKMEGERSEPLPELKEDTAYIALKEFTGNAASEFEQCLVRMRENGKTNLVLDLRGNGGGYMDILVEIASLLLREAGSGSNRIAYAQFRNGAIVSYSTKRNSYSDYFKADSRISILADEYTASASECLIGALVDYKTSAFTDIYLHENSRTGVARTYGKGIMQTHYEDSQGNVLKLTAADIYWPLSGMSIHGKGVVVDGDNAIASSLLPGAVDSFLLEAIAKINLK